MFNRKILAAALCAALIPFAALAAPDGPGRHHHGGHGTFGFLEGVTLTPEQKAQVHEIIQASWTQSKPLAQQLRADHKQIADLLAGAGAVTAAQLTPIQQQAGQLQQQLDSQRLATALQVRALLTPTQLAQSAQTHQQLENLHQQERAVYKTAHPDAPPAQ
ncbi:MAG TPA: periplasmic heavy metal sensor [Aliidongia sp.]|uniref:Spy/CpxP family protein refolding chaperone n=1 Tax=Aliidongia sp. TaxID=1914230 RepID=UPI002DDCAF60|nr:periplasmic heavy metal sensor [Aliidongia sp.]HEV2677671.1 periplasmic heavy metal sensor [Aliidongia sp.]